MAQVLGGGIHTSPKIYENSTCLKFEYPEITESRKFYEKSTILDFKSPRSPESTKFLESKAGNIFSASSSHSRPHNSALPALRRLLRL